MTNPPARRRGAARPYFMRSARLGFGTWRPEDFPLAMDLWGDPRVTHLIGAPFSEEQVRGRLQEEIATQALDGVQYWPLFLLADGAHVGCCGLRPYPSRPSTFEIGFHLKVPFWGAGLATEAARAVVRHAFATLRADALFAGHHPENHASRALLRRLGFRYTHDERYPPTGRDHLSYLLLAREYREPA